MTRPFGWALLMCCVMATPSFAADQAVVRPLTRGNSVVVAPSPPFLPPCREGFWPTTLYCIPRVQVDAASDPSLHDYLRSLRPVKRKPYVQVFSW